MGIYPEMGKSCITHPGGAAYAIIIINQYAKTKYGRQVHFVMSHLEAELFFMVRVEPSPDLYFIQSQETSGNSYMGKNQKLLFKRCILMGLDIRKSYLESYILYFLYNCSIFPFPYSVFLPVQESKSVGCPGEQVIGLLSMGSIDIQIYILFPRNFYAAHLLCWWIGIGLLLLLLLLLCCCCWFVNYSAIGKKCAIHNRFVISKLGEKRKRCANNATLHENTTQNGTQDLDIKRESKATRQRTKVLSILQSSLLKSMETALQCNGAKRAKIR